MCTECCKADRAVILVAIYHPEVENETMDTESATLGTAAGKKLRILARRRLATNFIDKKETKNTPWSCSAS
jgi:hypothetical protein